MGIIFNKDPRSPPSPFVLSLALSFARTKIEPLRSLVHGESFFPPPFFFSLSKDRRVKTQGSTRPLGARFEEKFGNVAEPSPLHRVIER